jgi:hypothetical protein
VWQQARPALKAVLAVVAAYGVAVAFAGVTTHPVVPEAVTFPIKEIVRAFTRGELFQLGGAWNLGMLTGLHGMRSLAPLLAVWGVAIVVWWQIAPAQKPVASGEDRGTCL